MTGGGPPTVSGALYIAANICVLCAELGHLPLTPCFSISVPWIISGRHALNSISPGPPTWPYYIRIGLLPPPQYIYM